MRNNRVGKTLSVGVVGCGYWGPNLIRNFSSLKNARVTTICDARVDRLQQMLERYPQVTAVTEFDELLAADDLDAVAVATPVLSHYLLARKALICGKHVFIEKPMARSVAECRDLIDFATKSSLTLVIGHTFIYSNTVRKIKEIVESGDLGDIMYISSRRLNLGLFQKDINVAWDLAPHDISIILYIMNELPTSVNCQGKAHINPGIEDVTNMTLNFSDGGFATIQSSWIDPKKIRETTVVGSKKMLVFDDTEPLEKIRVYDKSVTVPPHYNTFAEFTYSYHFGDMHAPYVKQAEPLHTECQAFVDSVLLGTPNDSSGMAGLQVVQILEAANQSLVQGGARVSLKGNVVRT